MALYVYNTKQQSLNAEKLAELLSFSSNDFCGLISSIEEPVIFDDNKWYWNTQLAPMAKFLGGGVEIESDIPANIPTDEGVPAIDAFPKSFSAGTQDYPYAVWGLDITIPDENANIITNVYKRAELKQIICKDISVSDMYLAIDQPAGNPNHNNYYEYDDGEYILSSDTQVDQTKTYYYRIENEIITLSQVSSSNFNLNTDIDIVYYGNTPWINANRFFIPICGKKGDELISMIFNRNKAGYESFLSARTYYHLLNELSNKFVFRVGGPKKGDIGSLNVTDDLISNRSSVGHVKLQSPSVTNVPPIEGPDYMFAVLYNAEGTNNVSAHVGITPPNYTIPVMHGGTQADNTATARRNLGFLYGTSEPSGDPKISGMAGSIAQGSIYFKIL